MSARAIASPEPGESSIYSIPLTLLALTHLVPPHLPQAMPPIIMVPPPCPPPTLLPNSPYNYPASAPSYDGTHL